MIFQTRTLDGRRKLPALLRVFCRDERAATALEFALVSMPFFALLIAILEIALVFFAQQAIETTGEAASRLIMTGQAQSNGWTGAQYRTQVCKSLPPFLSCSKLMIDVQTVSSGSFNDANVGTPTITYKNGVPSNVWSYSPGGIGDIEIVRVMYLWPIATGPLGFNLSNQSTGNRLLISTSVAKTEPYSTT